MGVCLALRTHIHTHTHSSHVCCSELLCFHCPPPHRGLVKQTHTYGLLPELRHVLNRHKGSIVNIRGTNSPARACAALNRLLIAMHWRTNRGIATRSDDYIRNGMGGGMRLRAAVERGDSFAGNAFAHARRIMIRMESAPAWLLVMRVSPSCTNTCATPRQTSGESRTAA